MAITSISRYNHAPADPTEGFPTELNTGVQPGVVLTPYTGGNVISTSGVFENFTVSFSLVVTAPDVIIRNCQIIALTNDTFFVIDVRGTASNCTIEYCHVQGPGVNGPCSAVIIGDNSPTDPDSGLIVRYCDISQGEHGIALGFGTATIIGNLLHAPDIDPAAVGGDKHVGGVSFKGGQNGVLVQGNRIICSSEGTSDIFIQAQFAAINNVSIDHNFCGVDPGFNIYVEDRFGFQTTNISITNNVIMSGHFGVYSLNVTISPQPYFANNTTFPGAF